jgi:hypothetical protein
VLVIVSSRRGENGEINAKDSKAQHKKHRTGTSKGQKIHEIEIAYAEAEESRGQCLNCRCEG